MNSEKWADVVYGWPLRKINFKSQILTLFDTFPLHSPILIIQQFPLAMLILRQKSFWFCTRPFENFTTRIAISSQAPICSDTPARRRYSRWSVSICSELQL